MFDEETRDGDRRQHDRLRRRVRRPRRVDQHGDRRVPAAAARHRAGRAEPLPRRRPTCAASSASSATRRRSWRPPPRRRPSCSSTSTPPSARCARSRGRTSRSRSPAACRRSTPRSARCPTQRPFLRNTEGLFRELQPGAAALRRYAPTIADALVEGTPHAAAHAAVQPPARLAARRAADLRRGPAGPLRHPQATTATLRSLDPTLAYLTPAQTECNYLTLWFRNVSSLLSVGDRNGTWQRFIIVATPQGPNNEGGPSSAPANGPTAGQPPAHEPVPEHGGAGPAAGVRGGQRAVRARAHRARQPRRARSQAHDGGQALMAPPPPRSPRRRSA